MQCVAVIFGGRSSENEISVLTGVFAYNLLDRQKFTPLPIYVHTDGNFYTSPKMNDLETFKKLDVLSFKRVAFFGGALYEMKKGKKLKRLCKVDVALNCCHGGWGEGGGVSALMELNKIPLASPPMAGSAVFLDKSITKLVAKALGVPTVEYVRVEEGEYARRGAMVVRSVKTKLKFPVIVKPARLGSSIGISVAKDEDELKKALEDGFTLDDVCVVEKFLQDKKDVNCGAYLRDGEVVTSEPEIAFSSGVYSFADKYLTPKKRPEGELPKELCEKIKGYTRALYRRMNLAGVVRMDFLLSGDRAYLGEVNTVPGSLAYYLFCERITDAREFFSALVCEALRAEETQKRIAKTGVLCDVKGGGKRGGVAVRL